MQQTKPGQRAAAQAQLHDVRRAVRKQPAAHHFLHIFQLQPVRRTQVDCALYPFTAQMQIAYAAFMAEGGGWIAGRIEAQAVRQRGRFRGGLTVFHAPQPNSAAHATQARYQQKIFVRLIISADVIRRTMMQILLTGASGLIGRHLLAALLADGHHVLAVSRQRPPEPAPDLAGCWRWQACDAMQMQQAQDWLPLLQGIDVVINSIGIIRELQPGEFEALHTRAPQALFAAAAQSGVRQVVHLSALGSAPDAPSAYWRSKGLAEQALQASGLPHTIIRPSLVYGDDGISSALFLRLASLPATLLPGGNSAQVQPVHIDDLVQSVQRVLQAPQVAPPMLALVGPRRMSLAEYLHTLRRGMGAGPALILPLPLPLARPLAWLSEKFTRSAFTPDALTMLAHSARSCGDVAPLQAWLGRSPRDPASFSHPALLPGVVLGWAQPVLRYLMAVLWLMTAFVSWFCWPHQASRAWLGALGIPAGLQEAALIAACLCDAAIGLALLRPARRWLWALQFFLIGFYTLALVFALPAMLAHPFGPWSKNLPILGLILLCWRLPLERR